MADDSGAHARLVERPQAPPQPILLPGPETGRTKWRPTRLQIIMLSLLAAIVLGVGGSALYWQVEGRFHQSTDNAFVRADISAIAAKVSGYVETVAVNDNQSVAAGDVLVRLDDADFRAA